jgi:hypothetical protein
LHTRSKVVEFLPGYTKARLVATANVSPVELVETVPMLGIVLREDLFEDWAVSGSHLPKYHQKVFARTVESINK